MVYEVANMFLICARRHERAKHINCDGTSALSIAVAGSRGGRSQSMTCHLAVLDATWCNALQPPGSRMRCSRVAWFTRQPSANGGTVGAVDWYLHGVSWSVARSRNAVLSRTLVRCIRLIGQSGRVRRD